jgi:hypothetical protein
MTRSLDLLFVLLAVAAAVIGKDHGTFLRAPSHHLARTLHFEKSYRQDEENKTKDCDDTVNDPVDCTLDGIGYKSLCKAVSDGQDPSDCTAPRWKVEQAGTAPAKACPPIPTVATGETPSTAKWVSCSGMIFDSICLASINEFLPKSECVPYEDDPAVIIQRRFERCRARPARPVVCRKSSEVDTTGGYELSETEDETEEEPSHSPPIEYENFCYARVDGFKWTDCSRKVSASGPHDTT